MSTLSTAENGRCDETAQSRCWLIVAPLDQVEELRALGCCQAGNGNVELLREMRAGDWLVYYSGREGSGSSEPARLFSALGRIADNETYRKVLDDGRAVERRHVDYLEHSQSVDILPLLPKLSLTAASSRRWGAVLSSSFLEIKCSDMALIAHAMGLEAEAAQICGAFAY